MPMLLSKVLREPSETLPFDMIILKRFSPLESKHHTYSIHHLCRYTSFVERPDSRAKRHSLSEISDLPSAIKGIVHPIKVKYMSLFTQLDVLYVRLQKQP